MRPLAILNCLGKALVRQLGNAVGFGVAGDVAVGVGEEVWGEWKRDKNEQQRRDELAAIVQMAAQEFRRQVEEVLREVAAGQPEEVRRRVGRDLEELPDKLRQSLSRPDNRAARASRRDCRCDRRTTWRCSFRGTPAPNQAPPPRVTLTLTSGADKGRQFVFDEPGLCIVGRDKDCHPPLPKDEQHRGISRHHCLIEINPPDARVNDMNSVGGTYVNGELIGRRPTGVRRDDAPLQPCDVHNLKDGDEIKLCKSGVVAFRVGMTSPAAAAPGVCQRSRATASPLRDTPP